MGKDSGLFFFFFFYVDDFCRHRRKDGLVAFDRKLHTLLHVLITMDVYYICVLRPRQLEFLLPDVWRVQAIASEPEERRSRP